VIPEISLVVPVMNEADNVEPLVEEIARALDGRSFEVLYVDDGSTDDTVSVLAALQKTRPWLRVLRHAENCGQSASIRTGIDAARAQIVATIDGDGQNDPADLPRLIDHLAATAPTVGMVSGKRMKRQDTYMKRLGSRFANGVRSRLLNDGTTDTGCGLKAFRRSAFIRLPYFDHMHRFLPALMQRDGYQVEFVDVNHRPRLHGASHYGNLDRLLVGITDLAGVMWLRRRGRRPSAVFED